MPEETTTGAEEETAASEIVHDDIMQRLLEYQRQLREGVAGAPAAEIPASGEPKTEAEVSSSTQTAASEVVDITQAEAELEAAEAQAIPAEPEPEETIVIGTEVEEAPSAEPPAAVIEAVPEAATEEPVAEPIGDEPRMPVWERAEPDLSARVAELEETLARVSRMVGELRERFQDVVIASDERLAEIEEILSGIGGAKGE